MAKTAHKTLSERQIAKRLHGPVGAVLSDYDFKDLTVERAYFDDQSFLYIDLKLNMPGDKIPTSKLVETRDVIGDILDAVGIFDAVLPRYHTPKPEKTSHSIMIDLAKARRRLVKKRLATQASPTRTQISKKLSASAQSKRTCSSIKTSFDADIKDG